MMLLTTIDFVTRHVVHGNYFWLVCSAFFGINEENDRCILGIC